MLHSAVIRVARPRATRTVTLSVAVVTVIFMLAFTSFASVTLAAEGSAAPAVSAAPALSAALGANGLTAVSAVPKRAVIVVGPVSGQTAEYIKDGREIAAILTAAGVKVNLIIPPHATWANVTKVADGADLFAYIGHGNGWPSIYVGNGEDLRDGMGLNPRDGDTNNSHVQYYGANYISGGYHCTVGIPSPKTKAGCSQLRYGIWKNYGRGIHLASDAIVLLNHLCYASGNAEPGLALPTQAVAMQRVDNHASGWLAAGARVVFALGWQPGQDIATWLVRKHVTMDGMFKMRDATNGWATAMPYNGWVGYRPNLYLKSVRSPGATVHLDPDLAPAHRNGYLRAVTGDLNFTTMAWWAAP